MVILLWRKAILQKTIFLNFKNKINTTDNHEKRIVYSKKQNKISKLFYYLLSVPIVYDKTITLLYNIVGEYNRYNNNMSYPLVLRDRFTCYIMRMMMIII